MAESTKPGPERAVPGFLKGVTGSLSGSTRSGDILGLDVSHLQMSLHPFQESRDRGTERKLPSSRWQQFPDRLLLGEYPRWGGLQRAWHSSHTAKWHPCGQGRMFLSHVVFLTPAQRLKYTSKDFILGVKKVRLLCVCGGCCSDFYGRIITASSKNMNGRLR